MQEKKGMPCESYLIIVEKLAHVFTNVGHVYDFQHIVCVNEKLKFIYIMCK
jgi:hypothetical protein